MTKLEKRCSICVRFDCGEKCECACHYGSADKIRHDLDSSDISSLQKNPKTEEQSLEGLSALFG